MEAANILRMQDNMQVSVSVLAVLVTAVFFLSRRRTKRQPVMEKQNEAEAPGPAETADTDAAAEAEDEVEAGEAMDVVSELEVPPDARGTFTIVENTLKEKRRRDPTESMITHPEGKDVSSLRLKTSKSPKAGSDMSDNQKIAMVLEAGESVLKKGLVVRKKYKGLLPSVRVLLLTDSFRLLWLDPKTFKIKDTLDLPKEAEPSVELLEQKKFVVKTKDKFSLSKGFKETIIYSERAGSWVKEITKTIQY